MWIGRARYGAGGDLTSILGLNRLSIGSLSALSFFGRLRT